MQTGGPYKCIENELEQWERARHRNKDSCQPAWVYLAVTDGYYWNAAMGATDERHTTLIQSWCVCCILHSLSLRVKGAVQGSFSLLKTVVQFLLPRNSHKYYAKIQQYTGFSSISTIHFYNTLIHSLVYKTWAHATFLLFYWSFSLDRPSSKPRRYSAS